MIHPESQKKTVMIPARNTSLLWTGFLIFPILFLVSGLLAGCGYHVAGKGGTLPEGVEKIYIPFFKNMTNRPEIEAIITTAIIDEFVNIGAVKVVSEDKSEAALEGSVTSYDLRPISYDEADVTREYRLTLNLEIQLVRASDGRVLWKDPNITDYEDFTVTTSDIAATKFSEQEVLKKMARDLARLIKERMLEDF